MPSPAEEMKDRKKLVKRAEKVMHLLCDSECEGRCQDCPADVMRAMIEALPIDPPQETVGDAAVDAALEAYHGELHPEWNDEERKGMRAAIEAAIAQPRSVAGEELQADNASTDVGGGATIAPGQPATLCFECDAELLAPVCPKCNPAPLPAETGTVGPDVEQLKRDDHEKMLALLPFCGAFEWACGDSRVQSLSLGQLKALACDNLTAADFQRAQRAVWVGKGAAQNASR